MPAALIYKWCLYFVYSASSFSLDIIVFFFHLQFRETVFLKTNDKEYIKVLHQETTGMSVLKVL